MAISKADEIRTAMQLEAEALTTHPKIIEMTESLPEGFDPNFGGFDMACVHRARNAGVEVHYTIAPALAVRKLLAQRPLVQGKRGMVK